MSEHTPEPADDDLRLICGTPVAVILERLDKYARELVERIRRDKA